MAPPQIEQLSREDGALCDFGNGRHSSIRACHTSGAMAQKRGALDGNRIPPAAKADRSFALQPATLRPLSEVTVRAGQGSANRLSTAGLFRALRLAPDTPPAAIALPLWSATRPVCRSRRAANAEQLLATCQGGECRPTKAAVGAIA